MNFKQTYLLIFFINIVAFGFCAIFYDFNYLAGDALDYWTDSQNITTPFHPFHVPFYPFLIFIVDTVTFGMFEPIWLMRLITFGFYFLSVRVFYLILREQAIDEENASLGILIFAFWPMVSFSYTFFPIADSVVIALYLIGLLFLFREKFIVSFLFIGLVLVTHKAFWPIVFFTLVIWWIFYYKKLNVRLVIGALFLIGPLSMLIFAGAMHHGSISWMIDTNLKHEFAVEEAKTIPIFNGLYNYLIQDFNFKNLVKGSIISLILLLACYLFIKGFKKLNTRQISLWGIPIALVLFIAVLNQYELWATARFSRLLALPLFLYIPIEKFSILKVYKKWPLIVLLLTFCLSNIAFLWHMKWYLQN